MKRYVIERHIPGVETLGAEQLAEVARASNAVLATLAPRIQWEQSYLTQDRTYCVYLAEDEAVIQEHARLSTFPATKITEVRGVIDPTTARG